MSRETIDFGIDLGTTNSCIAVWGNEGNVEVVKNIDQFQTTPSCVDINSKGRILVGLAAKEQLRHENNKNVHQLFKEDMGRNVTREFPDSGIVMTPEELSCEVLKELKKDVHRRFNEELNAAVITIPAGFEQPQIHATNRAATLAGFEVSPLCQEPVAAALAYGHQKTNLEGYWMIFDFGGGTFDAAVVQLKADEFEIVNHSGDLHLGGKDIDDAIMEEILIPQVRKKLNIPDFLSTSKDPAIQTAMHIMKDAIERAKIRLSSEDSTEISIDLDKCGGYGGFEYELSREDVNRVAEPYILKAVKRCKDTLSEKRLGPDDIEQLILVGGPTQMPIFREILADKNDGLGIPLEFSVDPMTVVAQGAAIFARGQRLKTRGPATSKTEADEIVLELEYDATGPDDDFDIAGRLNLPKGTKSDGFVIEFSRAHWRSGQVPLDSEGGFMATLPADHGENFYDIELFNGAGVPQKIAPSRISYLRKTGFREIPLLHTLSIGKADNSIDEIFKKGIPLPLRSSRPYSQTIPVLKSENSGEVRIPILEGSNPRADRNSRIGHLVITPEQLKRDLPAGHEIYLTISVNESSLMTISADIPYLDQHFETVINPEKPDVDQELLYKEAQREISRCQDLTERATKVDEERADELLKEIEDHKLLEVVQKAVELIDQDGEAKPELQDHIRNLRIELDKIEDLLEWPKYVQKAEYDYDYAKRILSESTYANSDDQAAFDAINREYQNALDLRDVDLLRRAGSEFDDLYWEISRRNPAQWAKWFDDLNKHRSEMENQDLAGTLFSQGFQSAGIGDVDGLRSAVFQLTRLLPAAVAEEMDIPTPKDSTLESIS